MTRGTRLDCHGGRCYIGRIRLSQLYVEVDEQRPLDENWVNSLVKNFTRNAPTVPDVCETAPGRYAISNSQHWVEALRQQTPPTEDPAILCKVHVGLEARDRAELFLLIDTTKHIRPFDKFAVALTAEDPDHQAVNYILGKHNIKWARDIKCATTLLRAYRRDHTGQILSTALETAQASLNGDASKYHKSFLGGLSMFFATWPEADQARLVKAIKTSGEGASGIIGWAKGQQKMKGSSVEANVAEVLMHLYNKGLRSNKLEVSPA